MVVLGGVLFLVSEVPLYLGVVAGDVAIGALDRRSRDAAADLLAHLPQALQHVHPPLSHGGDGGLRRQS